MVRLLATNTCNDLKLKNIYKKIKIRIFKRMFEKKKELANPQQGRRIRPTINILNEKELYQYRMQYINNHFDVLSSMFTEDEISDLIDPVRYKENVILNQPLKSKSSVLSRTYVSFNSCPLYIPPELRTIIHVTLEKDLSVKGIFRLGSNQRIRDLSKIMATFIEIKSKEGAIIGFLREECDVIELTRLYLGVFGNFEGQLIPEYIFDLIIRVIKYKGRDVIMICLKFLLTCLGSLERNIFEVTAKFFEISEKINYMQKDPKFNSMSIRGISAVATKTFLQNISFVERGLEYLKGAPEYISYIFSHAYEILELEMSYSDIIILVDIRNCE